MRKYTQRELKALVRTGAAVDITNHGTAEYKALREKEKDLNKLGYSSGMYGINGGLLQGQETGTLYAITARSTAVFIYF
jgi:hypothetical protein